MSKIKITILAGSLRAESYSKKTARYIGSLLDGDAEVTLSRLDDLEMFNQDYDDEDRTPESWTRFREEIAGADGVIIVTPEYNRSFPAVVKNAIDIASRPYGKNLWDEKPCALAGVTAGPTFAVTGVYHLRQPLALVNAFVLGEPHTLLIPSAYEVFDEKGSVVSEAQEKRMKKFAVAALEHFKRFG